MEQNTCRFQNDSYGEDEDPAKKGNTNCFKHKTNSKLIKLIAVFYTMTRTMTQNEKMMLNFKAPCIVMHVVDAEEAFIFSSPLQAKQADVHSYRGKTGTGNKHIFVTLKEKTLVS